MVDGCPGLLDLRGNGSSTSTFSAQAVGNATMEAWKMKKLIISAAASVLLLGGPAIAQTSTKSDAMKLSRAECDAIWNKLNPSQSGNVSQTAARSYVTDFSSVDTNSDKQLSKTEFQAGCNAGKVHDTASTGAGSGTGTGTGSMKNGK
jgi:hypothetical protein